MLRPSIVACTLIVAVVSPSTATAQGCVQDASGRVRCDQSLFAYCPTGTVAGNFGECVRWRLPKEAHCPPNMWVVDGECRPYNNPYASRFLPGASRP